MKNIITFMLAGVLATSAVSCTWVRVNPGLGGYETNDGEKTIGTVVEKISQADSFTFNIPADITYVQTDGEPYLTINAPEKVLAKIEILQNGSSVVLQCKAGERIRNGNIDVRVGTSDLRRLAVNSAADFDIKGGLRTESFYLEGNGAIDVSADAIEAELVTLNINGAGDVELKGLDCGTILVQVHGAGDVELQGRCGRAELEIDGAGDIDARKLTAEELTTNVHGIGSVKRQ